MVHSKHNNTRDLVSKIIGFGSIPESCVESFLVEWKFLSILLSASLYLGTRSLLSFIL
jgi:hypothetical protein